ncbi:hypothetical protein [Tenacibaculum sp. 190524A02b]|uniref:hypothetical protein n=1 Tax=Tenacibaculum vairaonense TaxID=3137860 RepID=UPI0031FB9CF8
MIMNNTDPVKRKRLYNYLKENELTDLGFDEFSSKYKAPENSKRIYDYLKERDLTTIDYDKFHTSYFGDLVKEETYEKPKPPILTDALKQKYNIKDSEEAARPSWENYYLTDNEVVSKKESEQERNHRLSKDFIVDYNSLYEDFKATTKLTNEERQEVLQELENDEQKKGFLNTIKDGVKGWWNAVFSDEDSLQVSRDVLSDSKKEAIKQLQSEGLKENQLNDAVIYKKAREIELKKREQSFVDSKKRDYLKNLSDEDKDVLQNYENFEEKSFNRKDKELMLEQSLLRKNLESKSKEFQELSKQVQKYNESGTQIPSVLKNQFEVKRKELVDSFEETKENYKKYAENREELGNAADNLDLFKRDYGWSLNFIQNVRAGTADVISGAVAGVAYLNDIRKMSKYGMNVPDTFSKEALGYASYFKKDAENIRKSIMRPMGVDDIHSMSDFGSWLSNTAVAQQIPILALVSTGGGGIASLGASSGGNKYAEMNEEGGYNQFQNVVVPLAYGGAETVGAIVDASILKGAGRVIKSATDAERRVIAKGMFDKLKEVSLDVLEGGTKEITEEAGTQLFQNVLDRYALGKKDVVLSSGIKDAMASGAVFGIATPLGSHVVKDLYGKFSKDGKLNQLFGELNSIEKQLNDNEVVLSDRVKNALEKKLVQKKEQLNEEAKRISNNIANLSDRDYKEIVKIEQEKEAIKEDVKALKEDKGIKESVKNLLINDFKKDFEAYDTKQKQLLNPSLVPDNKPELEIEESKDEKEKAKEKTIESHIEEIENVDVSNLDKTIKDTVTSKKESIKEYKTLLEDSSLIEKTRKDVENKIIRVNEEIQGLINQKKVVLDVTVTERENVKVEELKNEVQETVSQTIPDINNVSVKLSDKGKEYSIQFKEGVFTVKDSNGSDVSKPTYRKVRDKYANDFDFTLGEYSKESQEVDFHKNVAETSQNPSEIAEVILSIRNQNYLENNIDFKTRIIAENIGNISRKQFVEFDDENNITQSLAKSYLRKDGKPIDTLSEELTSDFGITITPEDIIEFIKDYPNGASELYRKFKRDNFKPLEEKFELLTGLPANDKYLEIALNQKLKKDNDSHLLDYLTDEEILSLSKEYIEYEKTNPQQSNDNRKESGIIKGDEAKSNFEKEDRGNDEGKNEEERIKQNKEEKDNKLHSSLTKFDEKLKKIEDELNNFSKGTLGMNMPVLVAKGMIKAMRLAVKTAKSTIEVIQAGKDYLRSTDWYKQLDKEKQGEVDKVLEDENNVFNNFDKIINDVVEKERNKSDKRAERLKETTRKLRQKYADISKLKKELIKDIRNRLNSDTLSNLTKTDITSVLSQLNNAKTFKRVEALSDKVDYILSKGEYNDIYKKLQKYLKKPSKFQKSVGGKLKGNIVDNDTRKLFNSILKYLQLESEDLKLLNAKIETKIEAGNISDKILNEKVVLSIVEKIKEAEDLYRVSNLIINRKENSSNANRLQLASDLLERTINDLDAILSEGKYNLKEQVKKEAIRLKNITESFIEATNHKWNDTKINTKKANELHAKKNSIFAKILDTPKKAKRFFTKPVTNSFEFLLGYFDQKSNHGEGNPYKYFYSGEQGIVQNDANFKRDKKKIKEEIQEGLGKNFKNFFKAHYYEKKITKIKETKIQLLLDGKREKHYRKLSVGQALYVHLVSKMPEARKKLNAQGWDDIAMINLENYLGDEFLKVSDFITNYLSNKYDKYNKTYNELLRTDLGFEEGYFPLKYEDMDMKVEVDLGSDTNFVLPNVSSGHLKSKVTNTNRIDTTVDAFEVLYGYLDSMERFHHYGRFVKDLNAVLSNKAIRNNLKTYDSDAFSDFEKLSRAVVGDTSSISTSKTENKLYKFNSGIAAGYIGYKIYTALKQFLSMPAYTEKANDINIAFNGSKIRVPFAGKIAFGTKMVFSVPVFFKSKEFLKKNSPHFRDRIDSGSIGDEFIDNLFKSQSGNLTQKTLKFVAKSGIWLNKLIDGVTISIGGKVYYDQQLKNYKSVGLTPEEAHTKAIRDFEIAFKLTQQSSDASDLSIIQHSKGVLTSLFVPFKNAQFSYFRRISANSNNILRRYKNEKDRLLKLGKKDSQASVKALKKVAKEGQTYRDLENILLYTHLLPLLWQYVASGLPGMLSSWDQDDEDEMIRAGALGLFEGLFILGDASKWVYNSTVLEKPWKYETSIMISELQTILKDVMNAYKSSGEFNMDVLLELGKGYLKTKSINPGTFKNFYDGVEGYLMDREVNQKDIMTFISAPKELKLGKKIKKEKKKKSIGIGEY